MLLFLFHSISLIAIFQGGASMLNNYNGSLKKALQSTYPELQFNKRGTRGGGEWLG